MRPIDPWLVAVGFVLMIFCVSIVVLVVEGPEAARIIILAIAGLLYALAALARALRGPGGHNS